MRDDKPTGIQPLDSGQPVARRRPNARHRDDVTLPPELSDAVGFQIRRATGVADALFAETFGDMEINAAQYAILMVVRHNPGCPTSAAGNLVGIAPNNFVPLLDSLTARGYIRRTLSSTDRRVRHLRLTPRGEDFCTVLVERHEAIQAKIEERMGHGSVADFLRLLKLYCSV
ncbi:MAG TPA: MarR family winged helix-turn-helix transcriptional regulator [Sphingobium sp.]|nr:MarR family winged helix-turn-helix transcriptional regulator [Sphingobium sp.]